MDSTIVVESKEETRAIARAQARVTKAVQNVQQGRVDLSKISNLSEATSEYLAELSLDQLIVVRDLLNALLDLGRTLGGGEVLLSSLMGDTLRVQARETGIVECFRAIVDLGVSIKTLESNTAKLSTDRARVDEDLRGIKEQLRRGLAQLIGHFPLPQVA